MIVGLLEVQLDVPGARSLKDKRQVLKSLKDRIRKNFNVSVAEVDNQDLWQSAVLGVAIISTDKQYANQVLSQVVNFIERNPEASIRDYHLQL